jgi:hypothetical protein
LAAWKIGGVLFKLVNNNQLPLMQQKAMSASRTIINIYPAWKKMNCWYFCNERYCRGKLYPFSLHVPQKDNLYNNQLCFQLWLIVTWTQ